MWYVYDVERSNTLGYDEPWHRDWLFWTVLTLSMLGASIGIALGGLWWQGLAQLGGGVFIGGLVLGGLRELVRGFREPAAPEE